jgi:uncharacterized protein YraI
MKFAIKAILLFLLLISGPAVPSTVMAQGTPLVLAFYYAWFDQNTWASGQSVDLPAASYNSADRATIEQHVAQAQGAGLDALVQAWYGPRLDTNQTETNFRLLLEVAQARGFKAAVDFETTSPFFGDLAAVKNGLATLLSTHVQHPAYLRYQGKPVIFFWRQQRFSVEEWQAIRNQVDPDSNTLWIAEGTELAYQAVFDGHHLYNIAWAASPASELARWGERLRAYETQHQVDRLWVATAMPGYNDTNLPRSNAFAVPRDNGSYYRETWQGALASQPDLIVITSFNEWLEGTQLEPSASYGNLYLEVTRELVSTLRGNSPPSPLPAVPAARPAQQTPTTEAQAQETPPAEAEPQETPPDGPYIQTTGITNVRRGPATTFEVVGRLAPGQVITVTGRLENSEWWQIDYEPGPDGKGWVAAEAVDFFGESSTVPVAEAPEPPPAIATEAAESGSADTDQPVEPETQSTEVRPIVRIPSGGANVRSGPGLEFELLGRLEQDTTAPVVARNDLGDWWQIEYDGGENGLGWVAAAVVDLEGDGSSLPVATDNSGIVDTPTPTPAGPVGVIEARDAINVRSEPSLEGIVVGGLYLGQTAEVLAISEDGEWWQIIFPDAPDQPAWVSTEFVRFTGERSRVPIFGLGTPTPTPGPTDTPTITPTPTPFTLQQPTFAPTATSVFQATSEALLSNRGTPDPSLTELASEEQSSFSWGSIPWGILSLLVIIGIFWYQFTQRGRRR